MKTLSIPYPESLLGSLHVSEGEFEREARMAMAVKLFDTGRLSSGQAADLAGMPRSASSFSAPLSLRNSMP